MSKKEIRALCDTVDWRWATFEGAQLHTLLLGLLSTFREKLEWLEEAETMVLQMRASREKSFAKRKSKASIKSAKAGGAMRKRKLTRAGTIASLRA